MKCIRKRTVIRKECAKQNKDLRGAESRPVRESVRSQLALDVRKDVDCDACVGFRTGLMFKSGQGNSRTVGTRSRN
jgi:hypothetical protein